MSSLDLPEIFDYLDIGEFLRDTQTREMSRDPLFSIRVFAACVAMDSSLFVKILQGKRNLSKAGTETLIRFLKLDVKRSEYFRHLVAYGKAAQDEDVRRHFEALLRLRPAHSRRIDEDRYRYFQFWYFPVVRSCLDFVDCRGIQDAEMIAQKIRPPISKHQASDAIEILQRLNMVQADSDGYLRPCTLHLSTGERWQSAAVRSYHKQLIERAYDCVETIPKDKRDLSALTLSLNTSQIERIRAILSEVRSSVIRQADSMPAKECNSVYQLTMQFFPVTQTEGPN